MKESMWGWWILVLGLIVMSAIMLITDVTVTTEENYYMIKQISEASMYEAIDYDYLAKYGELRISSEKYMENFIRRYAEVITINKNTTINFYDLYEIPPKVTVELSTYSDKMIVFEANSTDLSIKNRLNGILELVPRKNP